MGRRGVLAGQAWLLSAPMDGVPYPQPLAGFEPQYVPWGVLLVRPIGHPPRPVPPRAADERSQAYPTLLRVLRWGRYGHRGSPETPEVGSLACVSRGPYSSPPPPLAVLVAAVGFPPLLAGVRWWWWGGGSSPLLAELRVCVSPPLLAGARRLWWRVVPRHSWLLRVLGVAPRHSWLGSSGVARGVGLRHSWLRSAGLWGVVVAGRASLLAEDPGWAFPRHSWLRAPGAVPCHFWLGAPLVLVVGGPSPLLAEGPRCRSLPLLAGVRRPRRLPFPWGWVGGSPCCVCLWRSACAWCLCWCLCPGVRVGLSSVCVGVCVCACVVCGGWFPWLGLAAGVGVGVAGVCCGWSLATPGGGSCL